MVRFVFALEGAHLALSPGGTSHHLTVLRDAGLLATRRDGRSVLYVRTTVADALVGP